VGERSAKCFACDWSGDVFDFYATLHPECDGPAGAAKVLGQLPQAKAKANGKAAGGSSRGKAYKTFQEALEAAQRLPWGQGEGRLGKAAVLYAYPAANGRVTAYVARYERRILGEGEPTRQKTFRPISLHGNGWKIADPPGKWPLYNLPTLGAAHRVLIFRGGEMLWARPGLRVRCDHLGPRRAGPRQDRLDAPGRQARGDLLRPRQGRRSHPFEDGSTISQHLGA
jgi:hypothetical protein